MATIKAAIALYDGVTGPLKSMSRAMNIVINSFEAMQAKSRNAVDTSSIRQAQEELARAETAFGKIEQSIRDSDNQQKRFNGSIQEGSNVAGGLWNKLKGIAATVGGLAGIKKVIGISDDLTNTNARLNLIVDDNGSTELLQQKIMASAQRSRASYMDTASAVAKLQLNAGAAFGNNNEAIAFMEQVNKMFAIGGATAQEQSSAMIQLTQAMAAGALRGEELNSILEGAPGIARAIEQYMGIAEGSIKQYAQEGQVTAQVVKNALFAAADETNAKFESMPKTWSQIWTSMKNKALSVFTPILNRINTIANSEQFAQVANGLMNGLAMIGQLASWVLDLVLNIAYGVVENWSWISPIVYGVAAALAVYYGWLMITKVSELALAAATKALMFAKMLAVPIYAAVTGATMAETAAQWGLNAALYSCPIVWIIILIIALIAVFYAAVAAVNKFAGTTYSATGIICGAFMAALAFIGNILITAWNLVVDVFVLIYNLIADVANFVGNVFTDPVGAVCRLFFDLADTVLGVLQALASAVDTIFGSNLAASVQGWRDSLGGWVDDQLGKGTEIMAKMNADDLKLGRFEYGAAWDMGYNFGQGIDNSISGLFNFEDQLGGLTDAAQQFEGIYNNTGQTADNTGSISDSLDIAEEDLSYLRDIAEREAINRFTTAQINVEQHNENHIGSDMDLDGVMYKLTADFAQQLDISAEGVHF